MIFLIKLAKLSATRFDLETESVMGSSFFKKVSSRKENSEWIVSYEHVVDVKVKNGDSVKAGDVVAKAAPRIKEGIAMTEMAVWTGGQKGIYKYCPFDFLDESLKPTYEEKLTRLAKDWEEFINKEVYDEDAWVSPGCLVNKIKEA